MIDTFPGSFDCPGFLYAQGKINLPYSIPAVPYKKRLTYSSCYDIIVLTQLIHIKQMKHIVQVVERVRRKKIMREKGGLRCYDTAKLS